MKDFKHLMNLAIIGSALVMGTASADQQILDDLIVDGSACIGFDCVNGESFGFDTLRLKENNLRIHFQDTSTSASFPTADWRIVANDTSNGGAEYLAFEDSDLGRQTFKVFHGARSNALVVKDNKIGLGTLTPVVELEIVDGDTPTVRLKQDGSSGFTPQTWDIAGNETNYFIRDVTNGSKLPFRIRPGAPTSSIDIAGSGDVGIGTTTPDSNLDIESDAPELRFSGPNQPWELGDAGDGSFKISAPGAGPAVEVRVNAEGLFHINTVASPPTSNLALGVMYNDDSGALCWYDGSSWHRIIGAGMCN